VGRDIAARWLTMCENHGFALQLAYGMHVESASLEKLCCVVQDECSLSKESQRDDSKRPFVARVFRDQARGYDLYAAAQDLPLSLSPSDKFEEASPQGRAHAQSPGHPVRSLLARPITCHYTNTYTW
jgi:hypothetical protein